MAKLQYLLDISEIPDFSSLSNENVEQIHPSTTASSLSDLLHFTSTDSSNNIHFLMKAQGQWKLLSNALLTALSCQRDATLLRAHHTMGHWAWWSYLAIVVPSAVKECLSGHSTSIDITTPWLTKLISHIHKLIGRIQQSSMFVVRFTDVFPEFSNQVAIFEDATHNHLRFYGLDNNLLEDLTLHTRRVLAQWIGLQNFGPVPSRRRHDDWDIRGRFIDMIMDLEQPGILLLPVTYAIFLNPAIAFPQANIDIGLIRQCFIKSFLEASSRLPLIESLSKLLISSVPDEVSFSSFNMWHSPLALQPLENPPDVIIPQQSSNELTETPMDVDVLPHIQMAGNAILKLLFDIRGLNTSHTGEVFISAIPVDLWVRNHHLLPCAIFNFSFRKPKKISISLRSHRSYPTGCLWIQITSVLSGKMQNLNQFS